MTPHPSTLALTFLDPAAGIIAGSLALPALLLLYFLKLRRRPVRISSTLLWERAVEDLQVNTPFQWLRPSLLLLLQFLALALLAAALGRPAILDPEAPPTGRIVILIDRSASMSAKDGDAQGGTRLDAARAAANELIERLSPGESEAMVVSFASEARIETPYTSSRAALRDAVAGVRATDQPGDLDGALALARAFLAPQGEESSGAPATVVLLSDGDFVRAAPDGRADLPGASFVLQRVGPAPEAARDNVGVAAISARRDESDPELVRLFVRLQSTSIEPIETALTALIDGSPVRSERVRIAGASGGEPAEAPVTVTLPAPAGGMLTVSLARPDALEADNGAAVFVPPPAAIRLWLVAPGAPSPALRDALSLFVSAPEALRVMTLDEYERAAAGAAAPPDVVVFDRVRPTSLPSAPTLSFGATLPRSLIHTRRGRRPHALEPLCGAVRRGSHTA
ncbi:MAG: VWA domain-containing protein, partial [Phycisphaerales bacterium]|nr:VWA domain-containing protein [Phycisphaerales bacterium]